MACGIPLLPLKGNSKGNAPRQDDGVDIVDEAIDLFRSTMLFKNFKYQGPADKLIVYCTVFMQKCLEKIVKSAIDLPRDKAKPMVDALIKEAVPGPND